MDRITPGQQSQEDVLAILGSPSTRSTFGPETWYYISAQSQQYAFFAREELNREVIAIDFNDEGRVRAVRRLGLEDGEDVAFSAGETPTRGVEPSIVQQLIGNVGRFGGADGGS